MPVTPGAMVTRLRDHEYRNEMAALVVIVVVTQLFPRSLPLGIYVTGGVEGALLALHALGMLLVYRVNRFPNFAHIALASFSGVLFGSLVEGQFLLNVTRSMCGCVSRDPEGISVAVNFVLAVVIGVTAGAALSLGFYTTVLRRFARAPRLMLTVFSVFAGEALTRSQRDVSELLVPEQARASTVASTAPPWDFEWRIDNFAQLHVREVLLIVLVCVALAGVARYLRTRDTGAAIRAASENPDRAMSLGVDVVAVTGRVWVLSGLLAGAAGVIGNFGRPSVTGDGDVVRNLILLLAIVVLAKLRSFGMLAAAALVLGLLEPAVNYSFGSEAPLDAALVLLVGTVLLLQRARETRADRQDASGFEVVREMRGIPFELRSLPQVRAWLRGGTATMVVVLLALPWVFSARRTTELTTYVIFVLLGFSLLVVTGWMGQVSLGQFGFATIGAWGAAVSGLPMPIAVLVGACLGAVAAVVVGLPALRLSGLNLAVSTLAFAVSAAGLFTGERFLGRLLPDSLARPRLLGMDFRDQRVFYYAMVLVVAAFAVAMIGLRRSDTGRALIAVRANEATGQSFGIDVLRLRLTGFAVSGFLAASAGALLAFHLGGVPVSSFNPTRSIQVFVFAVLGGIGGIAGAVVGFAFMAVVFAYNTNPVVTYLSTGLGGMLLLMAAPGGLAQVLYSVRDAALRRLAIRLRIPVPSLMGDRAAAQTFDCLPLDENRRTSRSGLAVPLRYQLPNQWALDRYAEGEVDERAAAGRAPTRRPS